MSKAYYRKIVVNDIEYRWIAGVNTTKVQNRATGKAHTYKNSEWATPHKIPNWERRRASRLYPSSELSKYYPKNYTFHTTVLDKPPHDVTYYVPEGKAWIVGPET
jgi:hypothetical protein